MREINVQDLADLALGAAILGSGGGGSPEYDVLIAEKHVREHGMAELVSVDSLKEDDFVLPIAFAGAPLVSTELLPSGRECELLLEMVEEATGRRPTHLMPAEIGGANALTPFLYAARMKIPVLDADTIGRAFPEIQMSSCNLLGVSPSPAFVVDAMDNAVMIKTKEANTLEFIARKNIVAMGSSALVGIYLMSGEKAKRSVIEGTVSQAINLGKTLRETREVPGSRILCTGIIDAIDQIIDEGFLKGSVTVLSGNTSFKILYQNEYLMVESAGKTLAITPEIITLLESESLTPITSEKLLYGLRVTIVVLPAPALWTTPRGLELVGPNYFNLGDKS